ncbi:histidine kinase dimerization/phosphoacceptor domain -containing protein [Algoriphagus sp. NG3]|uniref:tetratricopeptide repeat-containing sensor histidine kinase n=1 Tax=Algoriphagus sp. NG3 TaxID=3097546 RepID=UPI002A82DEB7|nr:histidine kinase dimerization/phosphoacceptor domain -containing protein [Algoriphagus sp. NG3]WPR77321.1 histidine kinase dimerization/phosphoacceptor domain -containing protein [Algoriphagus sp. NG3]
MIPRPPIMFAFLLILLVFLTDFRVRAQTFHPWLSSAAADSVHRLLQQSKPDTNRVNWLLQLGEDFVNKSQSHLIPGDLDSADRYYGEALALSQSLHFKQGQIRSGYLSGILASHQDNFSQGVSLVKQALALSRDLGSLPLEAEGWYYLGEAYERSPEGLPERIRCYKQARKRYRQLGNQEKEAYLLKCIADMHLLQGEYVQGYSELLEALSLYRSIGYRKLHYTYDLLGVANHYLGNYQEAIRYGLASVESARATKDTAGISLFYRRIGLLHEELNQWEEGLHFLRKALANRLQEKDQVEIVLIARLMVSNMLAQGKAREAFDFFTKIVKEHPPTNKDSNLEMAIALAECHLALKQYPLAEKYYLQMMDIEKMIRENDWRKIENYRRIGNFYLITGQYGTARHYLDEALRLNTLKGSMQYAVDIHLLLFRADSIQGHYQEAIVHYQRYKSLNDSIFNEKQSRQIANLQIQYKTREKEQNIALLTQQNEIQQAHLKQKDFQQQVIIGGAAMLLLLLGVIYNRYRLKQQSNSLLENQQKELQTQHRELHTQQVRLQDQQYLIQDKNQTLERLVVEKERLLKEIHHRVKNNLQIVMSLLNSQVASLQDKAALSAIQDSQNRVQAMALIHQKLYQTEGVARIPMKAYIEELVAYLRDSYALSRKVKFKLFIGQIELDVNMAVPLGLIINEAITNVFKYAFPGENSGSVLISLTQKSNSSYELTIEDDGIGFPEAFDPYQSRSLGMTLIQGFSAQLVGELAIESNQGIKISLIFKEEKISQNHNLAGYAN